jgi:hypothetical protein
MWTANMKCIMLRYRKLHEEDGVLLYFLFLQHFAGTTTKNIIDAYSSLSENKLKLSLFQGNVLEFTNFIRAPLHHLLKAKETPNIQRFLWVFKGCMEAPNEEFCNYIFTLYAEYHSGGPAKYLSMLQLLDNLDLEYTRINNSGLVWKWCDKCYGGYWNHTHITSEHVPGKGKCNRQCQTPDNKNNNNNNNPGNNNNNTNTTPPHQTNIAPLPPPSSNDASPSTPEANIATNNSYSLDFV